MSNPLDDMGAWWRDNFHRQSDYMVFHGIPTLERMAERDPRKHLGVDMTRQHE